jgi:hypothetical protein
LSLIELQQEPGELIRHETCIIPTRTMRFCQDVAGIEKVGKTVNRPPNGDGRGVEYSR